MREIYDHKKRKEHAEKRLDSANISSTNKRLLLEFLQEYGTDKNLSQSRKNKYLSNFKKTIELFGVDLDKASVSDARNFISKVQELDCSERTKEDYFVLLKVFYKWYKKHRKYSDSLRETIDYVCDYSYKINKNKMPEPDILTPDEVKTLISLQKTPRDRE